MTVKIVRGEEQKGLVDVAFSSDVTGNLRANFRLEKDNIEGNIMTDSAEAREVMAEQAALLAEKMQSATGMGVSFNFALENRVEVNSVYGDTDVDFPVISSQEPVQTRTLYGIARSFVEGLMEMAL